MRAWKVVNHKLVGPDNEFYVIAFNRDFAVILADEILGHLNYSICFEYDAIKVSF